MLVSCNPAAEAVKPPAGSADEPSASAAGRAAPRPSPSPDATTPPDPSSDAPAPASPQLEQQIRDALVPLAQRPVADDPPRRSGDRWLTPSGASITHTFILEWSRPQEQDGEPTTVFYCESESTYWLHAGFLEGGLSTARVWYGPFTLAPDR